MEEADHLRFEFEGELRVYWPWGSDHVEIRIDEDSLGLELLSKFEDSYQSQGKWRVIFEKLEEDEE